jgi:hypothetical protein
MRVKEYADARSLGEDFLELLRGLKNASIELSVESEETVLRPRLCEVAHRVADLWSGVRVVATPTLAQLYRKHMSLNAYRSMLMMSQILHVRPVYIS